MKKLSLALMIGSLSSFPLLAQRIISGLITDQSGSLLVSAVIQTEFSKLNGFSDLYGNCHNEIHKIDSTLKVSPLRFATP